MKKEEFFGILNNRLSMIEQSELLDILSEYHQHIDMKMKAGATEEEAIADFGDVNALTDEILEAYHLKTDYSPVEMKEKSHWFKNLSGGVKSGICSFFGAIKGFFIRIKDAVKNCFENIRDKFKNKTKSPEEIEKLKEEKAAARKEKSANTAKNIKRNSKNMLCTAGKCFKNMFIFAYNIVMYLCGIIMGVIAIFAAACLGFLIVMVFSGYDILGITLIALGGEIMIAAVAAFFFTSQIKYKKISADIPFEKGAAVNE